MAKKNTAPRNDKAAAARSQAQKSVQRQERRTLMGILIGVGVAVVVFGGIVFFIVQQSNVPTLESGDANAPAGADATGGIPVGTSGVVGEDLPTDATRMDIYLDFMCPVCGTFEEINAEDIAEMREAGEIELYYHPVSILDRASAGTQYSTRSANAAATVADAAPEAFVDFVDALFANQPTEGQTGLTDEQIEQLAIDAGVPEDVAGTLDDGSFTKWVIAATDQAQVDIVEQSNSFGTPTVMIDRTVLSQTEDVAYFQPGALRAYVEAL